MTSVLFLGKADDRRCATAATFCERNFSQAVLCLGRSGEPFPRAASEWTGDLIVSYLARWIVPAPVLARATRAAINFHPAPPEYPGIGCTNFALYHEVKEYGVTCHHMAARVDSGGIIDVRRFPIFETDDVASLLDRTWEYQLRLFSDVMQILLSGRSLPVSTESWGKHLYTREELNSLARITPDMNAEEVRRRIRATTFGPWRPTLELHGYRFEHRPELQDSHERV